MKDPNLTRLPRAAHPEPPVHAPNAAMLIDFDNVTMGIRSDLQNQLRRLLNSDIFKGKVSVQRAYADWRRYPQYIVPLSEASIDLIFAPAFGSNKKNATDIRLAIDALELVFTRPEIGTFILLSGDSDFSSLVLKLKEYGKFVIGVGIRESASDLLVQNCDEYYSYGELTGLSREGEIEVARRDPWELVVDAVLQMKREDDVMRSDRLKQVMQSIDPNFDEKDVGFNRFSKFVQECSRRGLLSLAKLENGQYAIDLGRDANVPPSEEEALRKGESGPAERPARTRRRRGERRRADGPPGQQPLALAEAFELLKQALSVLGAVGEGETDPDQAHAKMVELYGDESDPVFESNRFKRFLRQAHDANIIELVKHNGGDYRLKLNPEAALAEPTAAVAEASPSAEVVPDQVPDEPSPRGRRGRAGSRRGGRSRGRGGRQRTEGEPEGRGGVARDAEAGGDLGEGPKSREVGDSTDAVDIRPEASRGTPSGVHNPRFRRGSRGGPPSPPSSDSAPAAAARPVPEQPRPGAGGRTLGPRKGSRGGRGRPAGSVAESAEPAERTAAAVHRSEPHPPTDRAGAPGSHQGEALINPPPGEDDHGLLRRVTAAFHRMVGGPPPKDPES